MNARATRRLRRIFELRPMNGAFGQFLDTSLVCLITTAASLLEAGFIRRSQVAWGFPGQTARAGIPSRWRKITTAFFAGDS